MHSFSRRHWEFLDDGVKAEVNANQRQTAKTLTKPVQAFKIHIKKHPLQPIPCLQFFWVE